MQFENTIPPEAIEAPLNKAPQSLLIHAGDASAWNEGGALFAEFTSAIKDRKTDLPVMKTGGEMDVSGVPDVLRLPVGLTIVTSVTGGGKTALLTELAALELAAGKDVFFFTGEEMPAMLAAYIASKVKTFRTGKDHGFGAIFQPNNGEEIASLLKGLHFYNGIEASITAGKIKESFQQAPQDEKPLILVDYVQLMGTDGEERFSANWERVKKIAADLKGLRSSGFSIVLGAQLNREGIKGKEGAAAFFAVQPENIREAADIEQAADLILLAWIPRNNTKAFFLRTLKGRRGLNRDVYTAYDIERDSRSLNKQSAKLANNPGEYTAIVPDMAPSKPPKKTTKKTASADDEGDYI